MLPKTLPAGKAMLSNEVFSFPESLRQSKSIAKEQKVLEVVIAHYGLKLPYQTLLSLRSINRRIVSIINDSELLPHAFCQDRRLSSATLAMYSREHYHSHIRMCLQECVTDDVLSELDKLSSHNSFNERLAWWCSLVRLHGDVRLCQYAHENLNQDELVNEVSFISDKPYLLLRTNSKNYRLYQYHYKEGKWKNTSNKTIDPPLTRKLIYSHNRRFMVGYNYTVLPDNGAGARYKCNVVLMSVDDKGGLDLKVLVNNVDENVKCINFSQCDRFVTIDFGDIYHDRPVCFYLYQIQPVVKCMVSEVQRVDYKTLGFSPVQYCCVLQKTSSQRIEVKCFNEEGQFNSVASFNYRKPIRLVEANENCTVLASVSRYYNLIFYKNGEWVSARILSSSGYSRLHSQSEFIRLSPDGKTLLIFFHSQFAMLDLHYSSSSPQVRCDVIRMLPYQRPNQFEVVFSRDCNNCLVKQHSPFGNHFFSHYARIDQQWEVLRDYDFDHLSLPTFSPDSFSLILTAHSREHGTSKLFLYSKRGNAEWKLSNAIEARWLGNMEEFLVRPTFSPGGFFLAFSVIQADGFGDLNSHLALYKVEVDF